MRQTAILEIGEELGRGALGRVVLVRSTDTGQTWAGKILHETHRGDTSAHARFAAEGRILKGLEHPNLVGVNGIEIIDGSEVLLMEYIEGSSLADLIAREAPIDEERILRIARGLAAGLGAAHHGGLIHRDLKPANVLIQAGDVPKIVDFGMARATSLEGVDEVAFAIVGTPSYMAPEMIDPMAVDSRADIYALGCILFEMAAGFPPYTAPTAFACLEAHRDANIPSLPTGHAYSAGFESIVTWCLAKSPADRPQSALVVQRALTSLSDTGASSSALVSARTRKISAGACAACGDPLVDGVAVCFSCGLEAPSLEPGNFSLFVVGPGKVTNKLNTDLRQLLLEWLRSNPSLGLEPTQLAERVPRLPFVLATRVSETSALKLATALESMGLACEIERGGRFASRGMRSKAWRLGGRMMLIGGCTIVGMASSVGAVILPIAAVLAMGSQVGGWYMAGRRVAKQRAITSAAPLALRAPLERVAGVVPALQAKRHRESLRAVVQRAADLHALLDRRGVSTLDDDLARMVDLAVVASSRVDELEMTLSRDDLADPSDTLRQRLRERDTWASRLLETAALLDALRARYAALGDGESGTASSAVDDTLADLRSQVQSLQEVQAL